MSEAEFNLKKISLLILFWGGVLVISGYFLVHILVYHWPKIATTLYKEQFPTTSENTTTPTATVAATPVSSVSATLINDLLHAIMSANQQNSNNQASMSGNSGSEASNQATISPTHHAVAASSSSKKSPSPKPI